MDDDVMISVDPHKASNTAAVMDPVTKVVIASQRFANTPEGYRQLRDFSGRGSNAGGRSKAATGLADHCPNDWSLTANSSLSAGEASSPSPGLLPGPRPQDRRR